MKKILNRALASLMMLAVSLAACAPMGNRPSPADNSWQYIPRANVAPTPPNVLGEYAAQIIGLPLLTENQIPSGFREYRFEVPCGMCLPAYLIRIRVAPDHNIIGDAYLIWFAYDPERAADTSELARRGNNPPNNCDSPLRPSSLRGPGGDYRWCRAQLSKNLSWQRLLRTLESLGVLGLATAAGYAPDPPDLSVDTIRQKERTLSMPQRDCQDIGDQVLAISALVNDEYRSAYFWCLESKIPGKPDHFRVARARDILWNTVAAYRDTIR